MMIPDKKIIRRELFEAIAAIPPEVRADKSRAICEAVAALDEFHAAKVVMLYLPIAGEVDTALLADLAWEAGKQVCAPKFCGDSRRMSPREILSHHACSFHNGHGLRSPASTVELLLAEIDVVIVPAVGFDPSCNRLGRGGGFYDRFLQQAELHATTIGVGFSEQICPKLPIEPHDTPLDAVVVDGAVYRCGG
ncbi:MAG: 5-formyltetrahydrofolate cyclo-ligase [Phycisphaerales bacterium]|nr:5-formyltetrahydrofolate cyclo-ligase [Phycisphaerales bacterium]